MSKIERVDPDLKFVRKIVENGGGSVKRCYQCATCSVVCTLSPKDKPFPRKEMLWAQWGLKDRLVGDPDIWLCHHCGDCTVHCPRGAKPGETLQAIRASVISELSFPKAIAEAVNKPQYFPALLLLPMLLLGVTMWEAGTLKAHPGPIIWGNLLPHSVFFEGMFMLLMGWSVVAGGVGIVRQWQHMKRMCPADKDAKGLPIGAAFVQAVKELLWHSRFEACGQNRARTWPHRLLFFGFLSAMITAGGAAILEKAFHIPPPLPNPDAAAWAYAVGMFFKILGILGAVGLLVGSGWLLNRRMVNQDQTGDSSFFDWAFLGVLFATGLTGTLTYIVRLTNNATLAYPTYFVHLSLVAFLLSTIAYTKFAHVFYRTTAMTYALHIGRTVEEICPALPAPPPQPALPEQAS
ncbi:MAG TPA: quinone-interacting membrane-bound oxidoreductase complex subunit QmoC [Polyangiaceae bacterium]|jgi:quinone-modifying oxidoreductase subunit QmoC|nr:MAG: sn-glycerol-3-phosphate dehydrogenase subunit C [Deltaproteobacteria bacterium ADurb.Bin207]HNZ24796.1 quinone-interacting membrane-bound oxidoreductase complex subunit QmoC [Polyangiaceae bacterium]HOD22012.1 quinone-interacting membrane-bound oxidoreductase complex subunit QmoC [Polyangiaceae bacterium]HOE47978.1 quinone-interacting membrane-bound oxidoreductase complex subunit QmoC [Polyangiaceae bacterium]HOH02894.1 quinone-interacting membrane-bound oxidoreductase complex subunit Q